MTESRPPLPPPTGPRSPAGSIALVVRWLAPLSGLLTVLFADTAGAAVMMLVCLATTIMWLSLIHI